MPLYTTVRQIKALFDTDRVGFPEPLELLSWMVLRYVTTERFSEAEQMMSTLSHRVVDFVGQQGSDQLKYLLKYSMARTALLRIDPQTDSARTPEWFTLKLLLKYFTDQDDATWEDPMFLESKERGPKEAQPWLD